MGLVLWVVPVLPLLAALLIIGGHRTEHTAGRVASGAIGMAAAASVATLISVGFGEPLLTATSGADGTGWGLATGRIGAVLTTMVTLVTLTVVTFARRYLLGDDRAPRFFALALLVSASTSVVATGSNIVVLAVGWIATGLAISAMVGHRSGWAPARNAARRTRISFLIGDSALVGAIGVIVWALGTDAVTDQALGLEPMRSMAAELQADTITLLGQTIGANAVVAVLLVITGAARSALLPLHRWLPTTLAAPTPVSAMLHAGVINGAGVLLVIFAPIFVSSRLAVILAFGLGVITAVVATAIMLVKSDVKGSLVWSTAGQMGFMVAQVAVGAFAAALFHVVGHAMYKAALFLGAGQSISHVAEHRFLPRRSAPFGPAIRWTTAGVISAGAMAGGLALFQPHLTDSGLIMVVFFGWFSGMAALNGWFRAMPLDLSTGLPIGALGTAVGVGGYVGGLTLFEKFIASTVPFESPLAIGPATLATTIALIALAALLLRLGSGERLEDVRHRVYVALLAESTPDLTRSVTTGAGLRAADNHRLEQNQPTQSAAWQSSHIRIFNEGTHS